ncbi:MAG: hypothetical protein NTZ09_16185 [Candidatus Hydrogenedentes bacterium]|nr:hypothetical protein [Candidatus Hydrogenedentota bacterium]
MFWLHTQVSPAVVAAGYENAALYQDVYPAFHYGFGRIRSGEMPLWNDKQLCGTPFQANPSCVVFQPLHLIFAFLPVQKAMALQGFTCLALAGLFFALFVRSLGAGYVPSVLGGVAYAFSGAASAVAGDPSAVAALAWAPLLFWALRQYGDGFRHENAALAGIAAGLLILSGAAAIAAVFLLLAGLYALYLVFFSQSLDSWRPYRGRAVLHRVEGLVLIALVGLGVSAVQWAPTLVWAWSLDDPLGVIFAPQIHGRLPGSVNDLLAHLITPRSGSLPQVGYLGAIALLAGPAAFFHLRARRDALFFAGVSVLAVGAAAIELPAPFHRAHLLFPLLFCLAALSAVGYDRLMISGGTERAPRVWLPAFVVLVCSGALLYAATAPARGRVVVFLLLMGPVVLLRFRWVSVAAGVATAAVMFADLAASGANAYSHPFQDADSWYNKYSSSLRTAEEQALEARVVVSGHVLDFSLPSNTGMLFPLIDNADGLLPLTHEQTVWWRRLGRTQTGAEPEKGRTGVSPQALSPLLLNYMAVRAVLAAPDGPLYAGQWARPGPPLREVKTDDAVRLFINQQALPRAYWTPAWRMAEGVASAADMLGAESFPAGRMCVVDRDSPGYPELAELLPPFQPRADAAEPVMPPDVHCRIVSAQPERVVVQAGGPQPGVTVLSDTNMAGWRATLDGRPAPIVRANGIFRGIATPAGPHEIVFEYRPMSYSAGLGLSLATLAGLVLGGMIVLVRR